MLLMTQYELAALLDPPHLSVHAWLQGFNNFHVRLGTCFFISIMDHFLRRFRPGFPHTVRNVRIHVAVIGNRHIECLNLLVDRFQQAIPGLGRRQACPEAGARNGQARRPPDPIRENA